MPKKKGLCWGDSIGKRLLCRDLKDGTIPIDSEEMKPAEAFNRRPEFAFPNREDGQRLFASRLRSTREQIIEMRKRSNLESAALRQDRAIHPKATCNHSGEPRWEGSAAEALLKRDMAENKHKQLTPKFLHESRQEYSAFPLSVFRNHIYQEERLVKYIAQRNAATKKKIKTSK